MNPTLKAWLIGSINALLSGAFATGGSALAGVTFKQGLIIVSVAMVGSFSKWFAQNPIPGGKA
jgi:hypothetical protein